MLDVADLPAWERLYVAMQIGVKDPILLDRLTAEARAMLDPESLLTLAALLAVWTLGSAWGGPAAWAVDFGVAAMGLFYLGRDALFVGKQLGGFITAGLAAKTEDDLKQAGHFFALGLGQLGSTIIMGLLGTAAFKAVRARIVPKLKTALGGKLTEGVPEIGPKVPEESAPKAPAEKQPTALDKVKEAGKKALDEARDGRGMTGAAEGVSLGYVLLPLGVLAAVGAGVFFLSRKTVTVHVDNSTAATT